MKRLLAFAAVALTSTGLTFAAPQTAKADTPFAFRINTPNFSFGINNGYNGYNQYRPYPVVVDPYYSNYQVAPVIVNPRPIVVDPYYGQNFRHNHQRHDHGRAPILVPHRGHYHVIR